MTLLVINKHKIHCKSLIMLQIACWFYVSDIKPTIIINQKVQIYQPLNSHIGLYIPTISMKNNSILIRLKVDVPILPCVFYTFN